MTTSATVVGITKQGRARVAKGLPGHIEVVRGLIFDSPSARDVRTLERDEQGPRPRAVSAAPIGRAAQPSCGRELIARTA
ncbi:hypothetical protein [Mycobacterium palustre]|uniref:Uncharacterized protein n=1 Tax=Mycobacterium palustre TaxID=153971 RepID=A0A1X1ZMM1_9MYCO|nr:hypothetical protein [Mycobacterium palustre]MCV7101982.1 hypothetical protein [Mycobacterium palustre]ORW24590.1 hypothetical protein AWC19_08765 [Mycobacterium palustre]